MIARATEVLAALEAVAPRPGHINIHVASCCRDPLTSFGARGADVDYLTPVQALAELERLPVVGSTVDSDAGGWRMRVEDSVPAVIVGDRPSVGVGSDFLVEMLRALGIEYAAFNPGSSFGACTIPGQL